MTIAALLMVVVALGFAALVIFAIFAVALYRLLVRAVDDQSRRMAGVESSIRDNTDATRELYQAWLGHPETIRGPHLEIASSPPR